ncbi:hypothetical protein RchiOBHm_Chr6g0294151 [Rosa chinensis]|uniref:Uncharacterized protein n=1 Tax=Rosa chinensis TaxID=74649 RepID=A0A2P6PWV5_ROSCH|nr:hypothetical protein RchiOBHm_Chr6g0294151 [Rosa chinensis]
MLQPYRSLSSSYSVLHFFDTHFLPTFMQIWKFIIYNNKSIYSSRIKTRLFLDLHS